MGQTVDLEAAKTKLPPAIDEMEQLCTTLIEQAKNQIAEVGKEINSQKIINAGAICIAQLEGFQKNLREVLGEDGDRASQATMRGQLASVKAMDEQFNG